MQNLKQYTFYFRNIVMCSGDELRQGTVIADDLEKAKLILKRHFGHAKYVRVETKDVKLFERQIGYAGTSQRPTSNSLNRWVKI